MDSIVSKRGGETGMTRQTDPRGASGSARRPVDVSDRGARRYVEPQRPIDVLS